MSGTTVVTLLTFIIHHNVLRRKVFIHFRIGFLVKIAYLDNRMCLLNKSCISSFWFSDQMKHSLLVLHKVEDFLPGEW